MSDDLLHLITPLRKAAIRALERTIQAGETRGGQFKVNQAEQMGLGL